MSARSKSRKRALDILYGADVRGVAITAFLADEAARAAQRPERGSSWPYAEQIVAGVAAHLDSIDARIARHAQGWTLARMPALDRAIARIGVWEILENPEVPTGVAIAEAVALAGTLSTEESAGFINGLLGAIARDTSD